jgi:hypothetical protein
VFTFYYFFSIIYRYNGCIGSSSGLNVPPQAPTANLTSNSKDESNSGQHAQHEDQHANQIQANNQNHHHSHHNFSSSRRKSKYALKRREKPNGVKPSSQHNFQSASEANVSKKKQLNTNVKI